MLFFITNINTQMNASKATDPSVGRQPFFLSCSYFKSFLMNKLLVLSVKVPRVLFRTESTHHPCFAQLTVKIPTSSHLGSINVWAEHRCTQPFCRCFANARLYVTTFCCHLGAVFELWAAFECVSIVVVVPLTLLGCGKDRGQSIK